MNTDKNSEKLRKKLIREQQKRIQPSECQKYVRLVIDSRITDTTVGHGLLELLESSSIKFKLNTLAEKCCIYWERSTGQQTFVHTNINANHTDDENSTPATAELSDKWQMESQLLRLFTAQDLQDLVLSDTLNSSVESLQSTFPNMKITLLFPSLPAKCSSSVQQERETLLTELQIYHECKVLQINLKADDLLELLKRFTKAVAEIPYKKQKSEAQSGFKKYLINDNKQCVRLEGMHGMSRLWQQHLNRLPSITLETAEAIRAEYSCPKKLLDDMQNHFDAPTMLADIQITRGVPALSTNRRIGNVLSNKIIKLYQTRDGNEML